MIPIKSLAAALALVLILCANCPARQLDEQAAKSHVTAFLTSVLRYPKSYQGIGWSKLVTHPGGGAYQCSIRHKYSFALGYAKDGREIRAVADQVFSLDFQGNVVGGESLRPRVGNPRYNSWRP